jgi:rubrerythrin
MALETTSAVQERHVLPRSEFHCISCGYGISVVAPPEECPMCRNNLWEPSPWRPFTTESVDRPAAA